MWGELQGLCGEQAKGWRYYCGLFYGPFLANLGVRSVQLVILGPLGPVTMGHCPLGYPGLSSFLHL